jgi:hypothetical protein
MEVCQYSKPCPFCLSPVSQKVGFTKTTGYRRYRCTSCGKNFSDSPFPKGSSPHGDEPKHKSIIAMRSRKKIKEEQVKLTRLQRMFDELQSLDRQGGFGGITPYSLMIDSILEDSSAEFCLMIAEKAINIGRSKDGLRDRPEPVESIPVPARRGRKPKNLEVVNG